MTHEPDPLASAHQTAQEWLATIERHLGTKDRHFAYRVLRVWLHLVRDRLTVESAAHFAAQLPEFLRGVYYDGWTPSKVPTRYKAAQFTTLFAEAAAIRQTDVPAAVSAVSAALNTLCSPGQLDHVLTLMPASLRSELNGELPAPEPPPPASRDHLRINALEDQVQALTEAVSALVHGLEQTPTSEPTADRTAKSAQQAHRILMAHNMPQT